MRTIIHSQKLSENIQKALREHGTLIRRSDCYELEHHEPLDLNHWRREIGTDINTLPEGFNPLKVRLFITDLDSTLIANETIDEIADLLGLKSQVAAITEGAMRGELDFAEALRARVALLEGLPVERLEEVYSERYRFNPFAREVLAWMQERGIKTAVVSGGFTLFTDRLLKTLPLDFAHANRLEVKEGRLTGRVEGKIVDGQEKLAFLKSLCKELGLKTGETVAMGDGANDLPMLEAAGLGIGYHPKPILHPRVDALILYGDWRQVRQLLGS